MFISFSTLRAQSPWSVSACVPTHARFLAIRRKQCGLNANVLSLLAVCALVWSLIGPRLFAAPVPILASVATVPGTTAVGSSAALPLTVTYSASGTSAVVDVVTTGVSGLDFSVKDIGTCGTSTQVATGDTCTLTVAFVPRFPGRRDGAVRIRSGSGALLAEALITGNASGALPVLKPGRIDTVAGSYGWTYITDNVLGTLATIFTPKAALVDSAGNLFVSDTGNNRIRRVDAKTGLISTVVGSGLPTYSGDGGPASSASISGPAGLALDGAGNLYVSDYQNSIVRRIDAVTGIISTVAGTPLSPGFSGNGGLATAAQLNLPESLAFDLQGNLLIADSGNNMVRRVDAATGVISTVAGKLNPGFAGDGLPATGALLADPTGVTVAADGSIYIADTANQRIRRIAPDGTMSTVAGNGSQTFNGDGSPALQAALDGPANVVLDPAGNLYFTDSGSNRVRMVNARTGNIETITGGESEAFSGDAGPADVATHYGPYGLFYAQNGDLYLTDMFHMRVRRISASSLPLTYPVMRVGKTSAPKTAGLINEGSDTLSLSAPVFTQSALDAATTTCFGASSGPLLPATECKIGVEFAPTVTGNMVTGTLGLPSNIATATPVITLTGEVLSVNPTTILVSVASPSTNPSMLGDSVTFQAQVTSDDKGRTGTVTFTLDGAVVCNAVPLTSAGSAACSVTGLKLGSHTLIANYSGDAQNASAISEPYTQVVKQHTSLVLASLTNPSVVTKPVTFTLTASATTGVPSGTVTFADGAMTLATGVLDANGVATFTTADLGIGTHSIVAQYAGDSGNAASNSTALKQIIRQGTTSTAIGTSNAQAVVGTPVTLKATVMSLDGLVPTGTVSFRNGNTILGTSNVQADGTASLALANLPSGTYSIVAVYGGDTNDAGSNSTPLAQNSLKLPTLTSLVTDAPTLTAGATLHMTAKTVLGAGATAFGSISGTVTFTDNGTSLGSATVAPDGSATFAAAGLSVGTHILVATYSGDSNYAVSSGTLTQTVVQTTSVIAVTPASATVIAGKEAKFIATVGSSTGTPTGTVVFREGSTTLGTATLNKGIAAFVTTSLPAGQHTLLATYTGDANYLQITSDPVVVQVVLAQTSLALTGPASAVTVTTPASFSAALSSEGVVPTGTLTLYDGATVAAAQKVTNVGSFSFSTTSLSVGQHSLSVKYSGDGNSAASASAAVTVQVNKADTATVLTTGGSPAVLGKDVTFTMAVTSQIANLSGSVDLLENGQVLGSAPLNGGSASVTLNTLAFGKHALVARYNGDAQHAASSSLPLQQVLLQPATVSLASSLNPSISGQAVVLSASVPGVTGLVPTGTIVFTDGSTILGTVALSAAGQAVLQTSTLPVGTHAIQASYAGDTNFAGAQANLSQVVKPATTRVTATVSANPATYGSVTDLTAIVQSDGGTATGSIQFMDGTTVLGSAVLDASGVAVLHISTLSAGAHAVTAVYAGDGKASPSTSASLSFLVKQQTTLSLTSNANPALTLDRVSLTAVLQNSKAAIATGSVTFYDGGKPVGTVALNTSGNATLDLPPLAAGTHAITASYAGDDGDFPASASVLTQAVNLRATRTNLSASSTSLTDSQQVTLIVIVQSPTPSVVAAPSGTVTFYNGSTAIGTLPLDANGTATLTTRLQSSQTGSYSAQYGGDSSYAASASDTTSYQTGVSSQFRLSISNTAVSVARAEHTVVTVTAASLKGFSDNLKLGCVGLPYAATCTFTTMSGTVNTGMALTANGSGTMQLTIDTGNPLGGGSQAQASVLRSRGAVLCLLPAGILLCGVARRKKALPLLVALLALVFSMGISGCGGLQINSTPAGTYTFQVTAVGQSSGVSESQTVTLKVGQ